MDVWACALGGCGQRGWGRVYEVGVWARGVVEGHEQGCAHDNLLKKVN